MSLYPHLYLPILPFSISLERDGQTQLKEKTNALKGKLDTKETQLPQQREVAERAAQEITSFKDEFYGKRLQENPRVWLFSLLRSAAVLAVEPTTHDDAEASKAETKINERLRSQVGVLEQQLRGTEARVRDSEIARETEKQRYEKEVRHLDSQLATVSRGIKESLLAKDRAKFEELQAEFIDLTRDTKELEDEVQGLTDQVRELDDANNYLAEQGESLNQKVEELKGDNRFLLEHNEELVGVLGHQVADYQTAEAADITAAVSGMAFGADD
ncbi:hypothetical protein N7471_005551 [Penicillium samsonianum]|uniref:uncharacterized protein n=1 Tax=Penicillium samsonianum TaxID=1882272 RepID=UPI002546FF6F|nr:uncharacterized protein N7471_005551 [Penicillium samsonianum]KAJ6139065.1 hypothetical protein N7471_005551 [Penicillium samsonianum]